MIHSEIQPILENIKADYSSLVFFLPFIIILFHKQNKLLLYFHNNWCDWQSLIGPNEILNWDPSQLKLMILLHFIVSLDFLY